ncbi:MAG: PTH1 family peptidyl-tRNA hydrolase [Candidatus Binatia bacterium]|jgi:PTH1 family peptidyl-tRNA hydrolase
MESLFLIVGLGNPGRKYIRTRHNVGFMLVDSLAERARATWQDDKRSRSRIARIERNGRKAILCQPQTFMNSSGEAVRALAEFYKIPPASVFVAVDDANLPLGTIRLRPGGSAGGHHGLESIDRHLGGPDFGRQKIGIGRREGAREITGHVLGVFPESEMRILDLVLARAADQAECWLDAGIEKAMNEHNGTIEDP